MQTTQFVVFQLVNFALLFSGKYLIARRSEQADEITNTLLRPL